MGEGNISTELNAASAPDLQIAVKGGQGDAALAFLETSEVVTYTRKEEKAIVRKIDWVLMPLVCHVYYLRCMILIFLSYSSISAFVYLQLFCADDYLVHNSVYG